MLTEKQKMDLENLFNFYSLRKSYDSESRTEMINKMEGLKSAVSILGYKFEPDYSAKLGRIEYTKYTLVKIN